MKSILAEAAKRKGPLRECFFVLLFYSLLFLLFFSPALFFSSSLIGPVDGVFYHQPYFYSEKVLWDTLLSSGFPMMADPQVMAFYLPAVLFSFVPDGYNLFIVSAYVLASCFTYGYVYSLTASRLAAFASGIIYGMSGFMVAQLDHAAIIHSAVWLPLIIWSLESLRQRASGGWFLTGCVAVALSNFAGHSQIFTYSLMAAAGYALFYGWNAPAGRARYYLLSMLMLLLGIGLGAIQIVPTLELVSLSMRATATFEWFTSYSLPVRQIPMLLFPVLFGGLQWYGTHLYFGEWNLIELAGYVGLLPIMLAVLGIAASRERRLSLFWLSVGLLALLFALGGATPLSHIAYRIPVLSLFRVPARHLFLLAFAVSVLAGLGIREVLEQRVRRTLLWWSILALGLLMAACLLLLPLTGLNELAAQKGVAHQSLLPWQNKALAVPIVIFFMALASLIYWHRRPASLTGGALVLLVLLIDMGSFGWFYARDYVAPKAVLNAPPFVERYRRALDTEHQRMLPVEGVPGPISTLPPMLSRLWGVPSAGTHGPLIVSRYSQLMSMSVVGNVDPAWQKGEEQSFNIMAIRYVFAPRMQLTEEVQGVTWYARDALITVGSNCNRPLPISHTIELPSAQQATKLGIVSLLECSTAAEDRAEVARVLITYESGRAQSESLRAGLDTSEWAFDCSDVRPQIKHARAPVFESFPVDRGGGAICDGHKYLTMLQLKESEPVRRIEFEWTGGATGALSIKKVSLIDDAASRSYPVGATPGSLADASRWRHVEDIEETSIFENLRAMPRAWMVGEVLSVKADEALRIIKSSTLPDGRAFDPARTALVEEALNLGSKQADAPGTAEVTSLSGRHIEVQTSSTSPSFLVLSDVYYPGWKATIDGSQEARVYQTNFAARGVAVPAGSHRVRLEFRPVSLYTGAALSALSLVVMAIIIWRIGQPSRKRERQSP